MGRYMKEVRGLVPADVKESEVLTMTQAAEMLGITLQGLGSAVGRGSLTVIVDTEAANPQKGRRLLLRSEVEARTAGQKTRKE